MGGDGVEYPAPSCVTDGTPDGRIRLKSVVL